MKKATSLSHAKCQDIVDRIQFFLYAAEDSDTGEAIWDPDQDTNGGDFVDYVTELMHSHGLAPNKVTKRR
jgi:hypothetical protein